MTAITVRGLRRRYGDAIAADGIDLDINEGEVFALLGPNGAGKTTTVEILEGHRSRDSGEVSVLGVDPARADRHWRASIGIVTQDATDAGELTVLETVTHFARYYPHPRRPAEVVEAVGLTAEAGRRVRHLSGGRRRRLDVAVGIVGQPRVLFLDEPTTGFDPQARRQFWELLAGLAHDGTTILLTTHYLDEAEALADRAAVVSRGRVVAEGRPATLGQRDLARSTVRWVEDGQPHQLETDDPARVAAQLHARLGTVAGLEIGRPSLEDIYLRLVGQE